MASVENWGGGGGGGGENFIFILLCMQRIKCFAICVIVNLDWVWESFLPE